MEIKHQSDGRRGSFYIGSSDAKKAEMVYVMAGPSKMIIEHTEVSDDLRGEGLGMKLLEALVEEVREREIRVLPLCPFAKASFQKREDLQDVLV
ncbi:GNAT family N-acetyltransferase [Algoriphagus sediminis]|uniref:GNAT family N-acetyltransferase n=1 Tax=Algoriphagus sediminis TaxID=3057113 RepID=A0ABT7Y7Q8_9BACT|nr:GNAT family N-acetyltransferase [Algoriphagus sediminis]MDN3202553.1 GNAT family N-acetyltransferase [Algoriphagus sediminis]